MKKFSKNNIIKMIIISLLLLLFGTGYYAYSLNQKYINIKYNEYNEAFSEAVNCINNVENFLVKATISKKSNVAIENLNKIWKDANLALVYLSNIPFDSENETQTIKFLNQVSDYAYTLAKKNINNQELTDEELKNIEELARYCLELENILNQLGNELYSGEISWDNLNQNKNLNFAQEVANISVFSNIDTNFDEYEGLIYDGAYSEHLNNMTKRGLIGKEISKEEAEEKIKNIFKNNFEKIEYNRFIENADIPVYDFNLKLKDNKNKFSIEISKKGGYIVEIQNDREVLEEKVSLEEADAKGKEFLKKIGYDNMEETYYTKLQNILTVNYAYKQNDVIIYPDLIKVKIALDTGEILGCEATGYLNMHEERNLENPKITIEQAKEKLNSNLNILSEKMAIIPTKWKTEVFCYEFKGTVGTKEFIVYINANTGNEEDILVILETEGGILTI